MSARCPSGRHLLITGVVQGVGFRYHMSQTARRLGIKGWVRNRRNGAVEAVIVGESSALAAMIDWVSRNSPGARVDQVLIEEIEGTFSFDAFTQTPDW